MNQNSQSLLVGRMEQRKKRDRDSNWNHAHTIALAELKREASLNKEGGPLVWEQIAQTLSRRFPGQIRTRDQCRRRCDTLVKVYNRIEGYCVETGSQDHRELDEGELASMKLATAYQQDWYDIVDQVCSQLKRKERGDRDLMLAKRSKGSGHSVELPERPPERPDTLCPASTSKFSTTAYAQVSSIPSSEVDKLSPEKEVLRLKNGNDGSVLEATQLRQQHGQDSHEVSQEPQIEHPEAESELTEPFDWDLESGELAAQPKEPVQDHVRDDSFETANASSARELISCHNWPVFDSRVDGFHYFSAELPKPPPAFSAIRKRGGHGVGGSGLGGVHSWVYKSPSVFINQEAETRRSLDKASRQWSLKVILLKIRQYCHPCGHKNKTKDMEMESKQIVLLKAKALKKALMRRKENVPAMLDAASSTSATSATRGNEPLQKDTERISEPAALDKKEETSSRKAERQQLGGKSSTKCVPVGNLCAGNSSRTFVTNPHI